MRAPTPFLAVDDYRTLFAILPAPLQASVSAAWGDPSGDPAVAAGQFTLSQLRLGRLTAAIQPSRGDTGDRRAAYHDADLPPCHGYIAFYLSLLGATDALVHLGAHARWSGCRARPPPCRPRAGREC